jgi:hypothetical protein
MNFQIELIKIKKKIKILFNISHILLTILLWGLAIMLFFDFFLNTGINEIKFIESLAIYFIINELDIYRKLLLFRKG